MDSGIDQKIIISFRPFNPILNLEPSRSHERRGVHAPFAERLERLELAREALRERNAHGFGELVRRLVHRSLLGEAALLVLIPADVRVEAFLLLAELPTEGALAIFAPSAVLHPRVLKRLT